jgi:predicted lipoprotein with Yx(FWY)xxD motif
VPPGATPQRLLSRERCLLAAACRARQAIASGGAKQSLIGTIKRANGTRQVTYAEHPLYTYVLDTKRGQTKGEGSTLFGAG